jgi:hypothetical protein
MSALSHVDLDVATDLTSTEPTDDVSDLIGQLVTTTNRRGRRSEGVLLGVEADVTPELGDQYRRALVLSPQGGYDLAHVLRVPEWRDLLYRNDWTLESLAGIVAAHPDWTFTRRGRLTAIERVIERPEVAPLRVMDSVYLISETPNADVGHGGEHPMPDVDPELDRLLLILERRSEDLVISYCPATGARYPFNPANTKYHRTFQATAAAWCPQRVTVIEGVARSMDYEYERARRQDGRRHRDRRVSDWYDDFRDVDFDVDFDIEP